MDKLYNSDNIRRFCAHIASAVDNNDEENLSRLLEVLKVIVCGPPGERCHSFYLEKLPADRCVVAVLKTKSTQDALKADNDRCWQLINLFLSLPYFTFQICQSLDILFRCLEPFSPLKKEVARRILKHNDLYKFDLKTIQFCLREDTTELELLLIKLCTDDEISDTFWADADHWVRWCALSSEIFQIVSSIFNELLLHLKCKRRVLRTIKKWIQDLQTICSKNHIDIVTLYPYEVHAVIDILQVDPADLSGEENFLVIKQDLQKRLLHMMKVAPCLTLVVLTHYPLWNDLIG